MEIQTSRRIISWRHLVVVGTISLLGACAQTPPAPPPPPHLVASNPPPVAPGPSAIWFAVNFDNNSFALDANGQKTVNEVILYLEHHPAAVTTIIGKTDSVGSNDYNMHLSHQRADTVRDAVVYGGKISAERVETRWTGETRKGVPTANEVAAGANRVVDIAIH
jgi:outer membrane protein OmpA-like peptidoglycan-associated protein